MAAKKGKHPATIKLNLVPPYIAAARKTRAALILTVIVCLLILGGMGLWWRTNATEISRLNEVLQQKQSEAQKVLDLESKAQSRRQEVSDISNALKVLDDIRKSGDEWANILRKIAEWIPEDVRITSLTFQGAPTNAQTLVLTGYTTSVMKLRDFYSQLSQSSLFTTVALQAVDKNGVPVPVTGLPPVLPKEKPKPEVTAELVQQGQPSPTGGPGAPGAPSTAGGPGMGMHGGPGMMSGGPGMGMHGGPAAMGGPGMGMHGGATMGAPAMGGPGMGMHGGPGMGGPGAPPTAGGPGMGMHGGPGMGGPGAPPSWALGGGPMMGAGPMMGGGQQQAIVRDPTAPRNAVYFLILATLARPVQVATSLRPQQPAAGMPGAMPPGAMGPAMPPGAMGPGEFVGPEAMESTGAPTTGSAGTSGIGASRRGAEEVE